MTKILNDPFQQISLWLYSYSLSRMIELCIPFDNVSTGAYSQLLANHITCDNLQMKINYISTVCVLGFGGVQFVSISFTRSFQK